MPRKEMTPTQKAVKTILKELKAPANASRVENSKFHFSKEDKGTYWIIIVNGGERNAAIRRVEQALRAEDIMRVIYPMVEEKGEKTPTYKNNYRLDTQVLIASLEAMLTTDTTPAPAEPLAPEVAVVVESAELLEVKAIMERTKLPQATLARLAGIDKRKFYNKLSERNRAQFNQGDVVALVTGLGKLSRVITNLMYSG